MFRNLCMMRKILLPPLLYPRYTPRYNVASSAWLAKKLDPPSVVDINIQDIARDDADFARNFTTGLSSLRQPTAEPASESQPLVTESPPSSGGGGGGNIEVDVPEVDVGGGVLDKDGRQVVPLDIDGWAFDDDDDGPIVNKANKHVDIGDDEEYKAEQAMKVPDVREGEFEYKGIKVKLSKKMHKDIGTYRYRRDPEDFDVADDMRVCKFEKK